MGKMFVGFVFFRWRLIPDVCVLCLGNNMLSYNDVAAYRILLERAQSVLSGILMVTMVRNFDK